ncbi:hypothetical protein AGABI2DRAFT_121506 [Agaricus bisporus var. bisporus H97]|uniref:hypothetical protein n=1 Tax=Agaricus bisporus var. bisporus (strain H97 / ATCC MYA-4626 / FGSC 10389) TaxID=936046 RepID=UPI00029F5187|nr:hypothetical protein AGABI2DRAFT_121506 [Agaricus bisporus var. bisporus H97]EKV43382.1 hypothetical protein AGABI2DRAFT_121506 [Agaricus bisporus var. bisporus H97]
MSNFNHNQNLLSERLLLLQELDYPDNTVSRANAVQEMKLLDTIAWLLTTGLPGDYYAVAFDKRKGVEVILAKNGTPTSGDLADAKELFSILCSSGVSGVRELFPLLVQRCRANVLKPVQKLLSFILESGIYDDFYSKLDQHPSVHNTISPNNIKWEFFRDASSILKGFEGQPLSVVMRILFDATVVIATRVVSSQGLDVEDFLSLNFLASTIAHSYFLERWVRLDLEDTGYSQVLRFQRCAEKLCRYVDGVESLVRYAKRLGGPIRYRWVTDELLGVQKGEEDVRIDSETPLEAVRRASFWSPQQLAGWKARNISIVEPWQRTVHTCLHPELRIILYFGRVSDMADYHRPIGLSKASYLCCVLWMAAYNRHNDIRWQTRSHYRPDATWALSAPACPNVRYPDLRKLDEVVVSEILKRSRY